MYREGSYLDSKMAKVLPPEGEPIMDLDKLVYVMGQVAAAAPEVDLPQFRYGFHGYQRVTAAVTRELDNDTFEHPEKMAHTMPYFAERAFVPMRRHVQGEAGDVNAWSPMLYSEAARSAPPSVAMVDFLGYHVVYDLPFTLRDTNTQSEHKDDYSTQINIILENVARELLPEYVETRPHFKLIGLEEIGLRLVLQDLFRARDDAWKSFEEIRIAEAYGGNPPIPYPYPRPRNDYPGGSTRQPKSLDQIEATLRERAIARMLSTKKAANFVIRQTTRVPIHHWQRDKEIRK